jgi:hypothetical protein
MNEQIKDTIQDCNINFLVGSGLSFPYLKTLGNIEALLTDLEGATLLDDKRQLVRASLYKSYFDGVIAKNLLILNEDAGSREVLGSYHNFLRIWNSILLRRKSTILSKEVNIFTTNVDIFLDKALEDLGLEYNDGFNGRFKPTFSLSNFKKSRFKKSLHYDNTAEIPVFNLLKLHGSLSWELDAKEQMVFSSGLDQIRAIASKPVSVDHVLDVADNATIATLSAAAVGRSVDASTDAFMAGYDKLLIVNPTKEKFKRTLLNQTYYELLRLYSNELEKENTVLFVMGFSFADEHICEITLRAANSNPTLVIYVIAHSSKAKDEIEGRFGGEHTKNDNVMFISPLRQDKPTPGTLDSDKFKYDLPTINRMIFADLFKEEEEAEDDAG